MTSLSPTSGRMAQAISRESLGFVRVHSTSEQRFFPLFSISEPTLQFRREAQGHYGDAETTDNVEQRKPFYETGSGPPF